MNKDGVVTSEQEREDLPASPSVGQRGRFRATQPPALAPKKDRATAGMPTDGDGASQSSPEVPPTSRDGVHGAAAPGTASATAASTAVANSASADTSGAGNSNNNSANESNDGKQSDEQIVRAGGSMAIATLISRITGFLRTVFIASALGGAVASAFNTANTLPVSYTHLTLPTN